MANTSCVDSEIFYQKLGEVKASKKPKPSKITSFIDDNFYNDAVTWLETRNEDSKDRTNLTTGNPGSLCVGKYREHMRRSLGLKIC